MRPMSLISLLLAMLSHVDAFSPVIIAHSPSSRLSRRVSAIGMTTKDNQDGMHSQNYNEGPLLSSRRDLLATLIAASLVTTSTITIGTRPALAATSTSEAKVTDKIYIDIKGLSQEDPAPRRIVIGLFGKDAPEATSMLKALVSPQGLRAACKPKEVRSLQKEQLEANKVYNSCIEGQDKGVNYDYSTIWRVVKNERIDVGAVSGRYVARQFPNWMGENDLKHDAAGVVSVKKGNDSGFGFTIYPGNGNASFLDRNHLVVGRVLEGSDVVATLNNVPVVTSAKLPSFTDLPAAPSRACRYGGSQLYCNEYKPLQKLSLSSTGVL